MLLVDARGVPLSISVRAAHRNDISELLPTLDAVVGERPAVRPRQPQHLCADARFVSATADQAMRERNYIPHVRPRGEERTERTQGKKPRRWVVEAAHSWFTRFRKLLVRYEKRIAPTSHLPCSPPPSLPSVTCPRRKTLFTDKRQSKLL